MDEKAVREHAEAHGRAVVENDLRTAGADLTDEVRAYVGDIMSEFPRPVRSAEVVSVEGAGDDYTARILYAGDDKSVNVESRWSEIDGRPKIVELKLV